MATGGDLIVRGYEPDDRAAVRRICHLTGYMGDSAERYWRDEESFADAWSGWYTDHEPESIGIVEIEGRVEGYLLGCRDTRRAANPAVVIGKHLIGGQHLLVRRGTAGYIWRSFGDIAIDAARRRLPPATVIDDRWPAHLHIDLMPVARGRGAGRLLMTRWLDSLRAAGVAGCHLETLAENSAGIAFFEAMGFRREGGQPPVPGLRSPSGTRNHLQLMVQPLG